ILNQDLKSQVKACEERLTQAMLTSDVSALDKLLAPDLIFTNHLGQTMTKQDDLKMHKSGTLRIKKITLTGQDIRIVGNVAIVTVQAFIIGVFAGVKSEKTFRFTRIWVYSENNSWQIISVHSSIVI
ncbi:MAG: nuclear transport factor 2 family protein, partial [Acidiferrobacterales bacterium]